jgi:hypothetical protein
VAVLPACVPVPDLSRCDILFEDEDEDEDENQDEDDSFTLSVERHLHPLAERGMGSEEDDLKRMGVHILVIESCELDMGADEGLRVANQFERHLVRRVRKRTGRLATSIGEE